MQKIKWKSLLIAIVIPLAVGGFSALLTRGSMQDFAALNQPSLTVPGWVFPIVWTFLYIIMGIASYLAFESSAGKEEKASGLRIYAVQLGFNFLWSIIFFNRVMYGFALLWLLALIFLVAVTVARFYHIDRRAGYIMLPYLAWCLFAAYLNLAIAILN